MIQLRLLIVLAALLGLLAGCAKNQTRICEPLNSWSAPAFRCVPRAEVEPEPEPEPEPEVEPEPEPEPERAVLRDDRIEIMQQVQFEFGKAVLLEESKSLLDEVAAIMRDNPQIAKIRVEGHTDSKGKANFNLRLSRERAASVRAYLISQGVAGNRLVARGFGMTKPIDSNDTDDGRARNRRVEFNIVSRDDAE
ncbi:OmpA family protein [Haliangium ochraceum]|uniref:OmpA/MotB domain protein n=1 Tax=Haliangium ochraceum (strain DSM 14365 / JCM 11303 / SMP-2) TaxID=502025 RepID=D0LXF6_HALO1|nr:OmpA family protein [Haliangium ochraceum]ACY17711.1 OmpA/MotB domain protein [Haliangium ochraceum DSM 14365]